MIKYSLTLIDNDLLNLDFNKCYSVFIFGILAIVSLIILYFLYEKQVCNYQRNRLLKGKKALGINLTVKEFIKKYNLDSMEEGEAIKILEDILNSKTGMSLILFQEKVIAELLLDKKYNK